MDYLYSLYDALVSINVPNEKARAVVDAMERDMGTTIATKTDLQAEFRVPRHTLTPSDVSWRKVRRSGSATSRTATGSSPAWMFTSVTLAGR